MKRIAVAFALVSIILLVTSVLAPRSYAQAVGFDPVSTIGIWLFEEEPELVVTDSSGNGRDGTIVGDPAWVQGRFGKALKLDGNNDYIDLGADMAFSPAVPAGQPRGDLQTVSWKTFPTMISLTTLCSSVLMQAPP